MTLRALVLACAAAACSIAAAAQPHRPHLADGGYGRGRRGAIHRATSAA